MRRVGGFADRDLHRLGLLKTFFLANLLNRALVLIWLDHILGKLVLIVIKLYFPVLASLALISCTREGKY